MKKDIFVIFICGGSCSGKTTMTNRLIERIGEENGCVVLQDSFYRDLGEKSPQEQKQVNFDHPDAIDFKTMHQVVSKLKDGYAADCPIYDFKTRTRQKNPIQIHHRRIVIVDGILILNNQQLRELADLKVYLEADRQLRLSRRINRDMKERGREKKDIIEQFEHFVAPMHEKFVKPSSQYADKIIKSEEFDSGLEDILRVIQKKLAKKT